MLAFAKFLTWIFQTVLFAGFVLFLGVVVRVDGTSISSRIESVVVRVEKSAVFQRIRHVWAPQAGPEKALDEVWDAEAKRLETIVDKVKSQASAPLRDTETDSETETETETGLKALE